MNGNYNITILTPLGAEKGTIFLDADGEKLNGILKIMGKSIIIRNAMQVQCIFIQ
ncbi:hypothetical protein Amet_0280 [Alkaliphilus metalliredigens QYMF]|uniref:Uncharacterized protein n=1 Tax=Alkaliphilus metalliredigens (strain QYMF) TaxID=293826 RepID=A6TJZ4_ALKMQ|nr:hypothetical protein [Alkaliphilus metalliredigens]ABR46512.1 hypothetical protein Amet_0280 [Alkaliphilus metalliredigens QYMF]